MLSNVSSRAIWIVLVLASVYAICEGRKVSWEDVYSQRHSSVIPLRHWNNKSYYMGVHQKLKWFDAVDFCHEIHMRLLAIRSQEENDMIYRYIREASKGFDYWTGGTKLIDGQNWIWLPYGEEIDYTFWGKDQPSDPNGEKCLQLWKQDDKLHWNDRPCDTQFYFICERYDT